MLDGIVAKMFPALVGPGDDDEVVCRLVRRNGLPVGALPGAAASSAIAPKFLLDSSAN